MTPNSPCEETIIVQSHKRVVFEGNVALKITGKTEWDLIYLDFYLMLSHRLIHLETYTDLHHYGFRNKSHNNQQSI